MPPATTIKKFIKAVNDGKSEIAKKLDASSNKCSDSSYPNYRRDLHEAIDAWDPTTSLDTAPDLVAALELTAKEVSHIDEWGQGNNRLIELRQVALDATQRAGPRAMEFFWEMVFDGLNASDQTINPGVAPNPITVTFFTPSQKVKKGWLTLGEIEVEI